MPEKKKPAGLNEVLAKAQAELPKAEKASNNPYFKSKYAGLNEVIDAVRPVLNRHGIAVTQRVDFTPETVETSPTGGEVRKVLQAYLRTELALGSESISSIVPLEYKKGDAQSLGSAITYARRYGLQSLVCLATDEPDDDGNAAVGDTAMADKMNRGGNHRGLQAKPKATADDFALK